MKFKSIIIGLIFLGFILTPIYGSVELLSLLPSLAGMLNKGLILIFKVTKDIILAGVLFLFAFELIKSMKILRNTLLWVLLSLLAVACYITYMYNGILMMVIGMRVFAPMLLIFVGAKYFDDRQFAGLTRILTWVAFLEYCAAIVQMFFALHVMGSSYFGLAARPFGTFVEPSSFAIFICLAVVMNLANDHYYRKRIRANTWLFVLISIFFIVLSGSGTGLLGIAVIFLVYVFLFSRIPALLKAGIAPMIVLSPILILLSLPVLTNRENIYKSLFGRVEIFSDLVFSSDLKGMLIGNGIGMGSNAAVTLLGNPNKGNHVDANQFIADSFYASVLSQVGAVFLILFIIFSLYIFWKALANRHKRLAHYIVLMFVPLMLMVSFGSIIIEVFPFNWLMFLLFGAVIRKGMIDEIPMRNT